VQRRRADYQRFAARSLSRGTADRLLHGPLVICASTRCPWIAGTLWFIRVWI